MVLQNEKRSKSRIYMAAWIAKFMAGKRED